MFRCVVRMLVVIAGLTFVSTASAQVQPYGFNDYGGFRNILPPGTNGLDDARAAGPVQGHRHAPAAQLRSAGHVLQPDHRGGLDHPADDP